VIEITLENGKTVVLTYLDSGLSSKAYKGDDGLVYSFTIPRMIAEKQFIQDAYDPQNPHLIYPRNMGEYVVDGQDYIVFQMPYLYPLNPTNRKIAERLTSMANDGNWSVRLSSKAQSDGMDQGIVNAIVLLENTVVNWINPNHDPKVLDMEWDFGENNFLQDENGNLVFFDPVLISTY